MTENFQNVWREKDIQIHEAHKTSNMLNLKKSTANHIKIKPSKVKDREKNLKETI